MSIKNQRPLFISAAVIIGLTIASLFGLNLIVDSISKLSPPSIAMAEPTRAPSKSLGTDDATDKANGFPSGAPPEGGKYDQDQRPPTRPKMPDMRDRQPDDAMRRVRNGKDAPDLRRTQPKAPNGKDDALDPNQKGTPPYPPNGGGGGYPPIQVPEGAKLDPQERERIEKELERRRDMYYGAPPPGYYQQPPYQPDQQNGNDGYDNGGYDYGNEDYYDEYDPDFDNLDSMREESDAENYKTAASLSNQPFDNEPEANQDEESDDYIFEEPER